MTFPKPTREQLETFYFFQLGIWTNVLTFVIWIAIDDILIGTLWSTTVVMIAYSIPDILAKVFSPSFISRISFHLSFALLTISLVASLILLVIIEDIRVRIAGVTVLGIATGFAIIVCMRMLAYYDTADVFASAYQNGLQFAVFVATFGYTGLTTWFCIAPRTAIAICIPFCFIPLGVYILLDKEPLKDHLQGKASRVQYTKVPEEEFYSDKQGEPTHEYMNDFLVLFKTFPLVIYSYLCMMCIHFSMTAVLTTLTFPSSPFLPRDHFQYYRLINDAGIGAGGLGSLMLGCTGHKCINKFFGIRNTGVLVAINVAHTLFYVFASWYRFLPNIIPLFVLCFTQGLLHGLGSIQIIICAANLFSNPQDKGTALGFHEVGVSVGRIAAAFLGLFVEKYLREHCEYNLMLGEYCLARIPSSAGWSTNLSCRK